MTDKYRDTEVENASYSRMFAARARAFSVRLSGV